MWERFKQPGSWGRFAAAILLILLLMGLSGAGIFWGYQAPITPPAGTSGKGLVFPLYLAASVVLAGMFVWSGRILGRRDPHFLIGHFLVSGLVIAIAPWITAWLAHRYGRSMMTLVQFPIALNSSAFLLLLASFQRDRFIAETRTRSGDAVSS